MCVYDIFVLSIITTRIINALFSLEGFIIVIYSVQGWREDEARGMANKISVFNCWFATGFLATKGLNVLSSLGCLWPVSTSCYNGGFLSWPSLWTDKSMLLLDTVSFFSAKKQKYIRSTQLLPNQHHFEENDTCPQLKVTKNNSGWMYLYKISHLMDCSLVQVHWTLQNVAPSN